MNKAYKFRIYPNAEQKELLAKTFGCVRFIYNKMLADKIEHYKNTGKKLNNNFFVKVIKFLIGYTLFCF